MRMSIYTYYTFIIHFCLLFINNKILEKTLICYKSIVFKYIPSYYCKMFFITLIKTLFTLKQLLLL